MSISIEGVSPELRQRERGLVARLVARQRQLVSIAAVGLVIVAAAIGWWHTRAAEIRYVSIPATEGPVAARVTANGTIAAQVTVQVGSQVSGRIQEILVDFNDKVTRGQVLARLDGELFRASVAQARANLTAAQGNLVRARAQAANTRKVLGRTRTLASKGLIAGADVDKAETDAISARGDTAAAIGSVAQAQAQLRQTVTNLNYTTIASPVDGVVISRNVDVGQTVAAALQAPTLFTIAQDLRTMQVHTSVPEADVGKLQAGAKASFTVDAFPDDRWDGVVREIRNASQVTQNVVTYDAVVDVQNRSARLRPGMTATVTFEYATRAHALLIPNSALRFKPRGDDDAARSDRGSDDDSAKSDEPRGASAPAKSKIAGRRAVYVLVDGRAVRRLVKLGISDGKLTEVASGELTAGEAVIIDERGTDAKRPEPPRPSNNPRRLPTRL